jgi:type IV secretory pathway TraG/TraD family ATPase VirD4
VLNPLIYPEISPIFGRLILIDSKKAVHKFYGDESRKFFIYDEIASYSSHALLDLVNKSRSANVTCVLATQSLSDLDDVSEHFKEQVIENCNNYVILRQNSSVNAEKWSSVLGTRRSIATTSQISGQQETGLGSSRTVRTFHYHPDDIKTLQTGEGIFISKDYNYHSEIKINKPF